MSNLGRGRGYRGRHHQPEPRPGDERTPRSQGSGRGYKGRHQQQELRPGDELDLDVPWSVTELTPRSPGPLEIEPNREAKEPQENKEEKETMDIKYHVTSKEDEAALHELLTIDEQYTPLLDLLELFMLGEDGIKFIVKLRHFETAVNDMCPDEVKLHEAFSTFRAAALLSPVTARKLTAVGVSFTGQQRLKKLNGALLTTVLQETFSKLDLLQRTNPVFLINAANLIGDYFAEARLCDGSTVHILGSPLVRCMEALLACDEVAAHRSLAIQLLQNGRVLSSVLEQDLNDLSVSIRLRLIHPPPVASTWLLLASDICLNKFLPLSNKLQHFYAKNLDLSFDKDHTEVNYKSWRKKKEEKSVLNANAQRFHPIT